MVIVCSQETTGFGLSDGEVLRLTAPSYLHAPTVLCSTPEDGMSIQRVSEGYDFDAVSLGFENSEKGIISYANSLAENSLIINEVMTSNKSYLRGPYATTCDWVELYNGTKEAVDLSEYTLSDDPDAIGIHSLPQITLDPGEYQILLLSEDSRNLINGYPILPFSLSASGEPLYLEQNGTVVDYVFIPALDQNASFGRAKDGFAVLNTPSPGSENGEVARISEKPATLTAQGVYDDVASLNVVLCGNGPIYYTTDCSKPTKNSKLYEDGITLDRTTVVRAICIEDGKVASGVLDLIYVINEDDALPVVSIITNPQNLWSDSSGIYVAGGGRPEGTLDPTNNYFQDWERAATVSFFDSDGSGFTAPCGIKIYGSHSRKEDKKALSVLFRSNYGLSELDYPLFGDEGVDTYESFILRASGQDAFWSRMRDVLITSIAAEQTDIAVQKYRAVVLYLNGEYWGLHYIREKISEHYVAANYNVSADTVTLAEGHGSSVKAYRDLLTYARTHDLSQQIYFDEIGTMMDIPQYTDYIIAQVCIANGDNSNIRYFTYEGGKWTWILYDTDLAFIHTNGNTVLGHLSLGEAGTGSDVSAVLVQSLFKNKDYRDYFLERMAWQINNIWTEENISTHITAMVALIEPVMEKECARWDCSFSRWMGYVDSLYNFAKVRTDYLLPYIQDYFDLSDAEMRQYGFTL